MSLRITWIKTCITKYASFYAECYPLIHGILSSLYSLFKKNKISFLALKSTQDFTVCVFFVSLLKENAANKLILLELSQLLFKKLRDKLS